MANKRYKVMGKFNGKSISEIVIASNKKQAKLRAGFQSGNGGFMLKPFMNSRGIRVKEI